MVARRTLAIAHARAVAGEVDPTVTRDRIRESGTALGLVAGRDYVIRTVIRHLRLIASPRTAALIRALR